MLGAIIIFGFIIQILYSLSYNFSKIKNEYWMFDMYFIDMDFKQKCFHVLAVIPTINVLFSPAFIFLSIFNFICILHGIGYVIWFGVISVGIIISYFKCKEYAMISSSELYVYKNDDGTISQYPRLAFYIYMLGTTILYPYVVPVNYILCFLWKIIKILTINNKFYKVYINSLKESN